MEGNSFELEKKEPSQIRKEVSRTNQEEKRGLTFSAIGEQLEQGHEKID